MTKKVILTLLLVVSLVVFIYAAYNIITTLVDYGEGEAAYNELQQFVQPPAPTPPTTLPIAPDAPVSPDAPETPGIAYPQVDFDQLLEVNNNVVGWIYIEGTNINYPIVLGADNDYYISHMINGKKNKAGSIFMDYRNHGDFLDDNTILYGHNMKNDTMFADITNFRNQEYYDAHPIGLIMTPDGNFYFEIIAAHVANVNSSAWQLAFDSADAKLDWAQKAMGKSGFVSRYTPTATDKLITLSTCSYEYNNARFVLVGVLK